MNIKLKSVSAAWMVITMPMNLLDWIQVNLPSKEIPIVTAVDGGFRLTTRHSAGGFAYLLQNPIEVTDEMKLSWQWMISRFPSTIISKAVDKNNDDYALRVGVLFSDGKRTMTMPPSLKDQLSKNGRNLSYVVFYCATPESEPVPTCIQNPFSSNVLNCLKRAGTTKKQESVFPGLDLKRSMALSGQETSQLKIIGLWLFADSDNAASESDAWVSQLELRP